MNGETEPIFSMPMHLESRYANYRSSLSAIDRWHQQNSQKKKIPGFLNVSLGFPISGNLELKNLSKIDYY